jgi:formate-dependent nitrite reductase membrane component NrfD
MLEKPISGKPSYIGRYGGLSVPGTRAGAVVSIGLVVLAWLAIPIARPFILGTVGLGVIVGLILRWWHNKSSE